MPLNIPQCIGQPLKTKNYLAPKVKSAKVENPSILAQHWAGDGVTELKNRSTTSYSRKEVLKNALTGF